MKSRRILLTGLSTYWGGKLAQALEKDPEVEAIVGIDPHDPTCELERTEFVRVGGSQHALIRRVVQAAEIDTVIDTRLVVDSVTTSTRDAHENNVIGTMNILAGATGPDSPVRKLIFKSSAHYYGCEQDDPAFFTEQMGRPHPPRTSIERDIVEAEAAVQDFADRNPGVTVTVLRFCNGVGPTIRTSHMKLFSLPVVPTILGFDPRYQFIHEDDIVGSLEHAVRHDLDGVYNGAADGVLVLSEVIGLLGKQNAPILPPWGTGLAVGPLHRLGLPLPMEMLHQMRFGRALDNRKLKAAGYRYRYTTREAVTKLREHQRLHPLLRGTQEPYRYEREVEEFLRWSPSVQGGRTIPGVGRIPAQQLADLQESLGAESERPGPANVAPARKRAKPRPRTPAPPPPAPPGPPVEEYDELEAEEVVALLGSLEPRDLGTLRRHEAENRARPGVLHAIDSILARARSQDPVQG
jgi:UDP-glucose 4-epimerase